jgi:aspartyl protease family protein
MPGMGRMSHIGGNTNMIAVGWVLLLGAMLWFFIDWNEREANPNRNVLVSSSAEMVLQRSRDGHYYAEGEINGRQVKFLLDTGATQIALSRRLADSLGLSLGAAMTMQTAAGPATGYPTRLARVRLGAIEMQDLGAVVAEGMSDESVLLGMNFLKRLELVQRGDQLTLRPPAAGAQAQ